MRPEDWQYNEGRLLCVSRAVRLEDVRTDISLLLIINTSDRHAFLLPQPPLPWKACLDSAHLELPERDLETAEVEVEAHSVQLLTVIVAAAPPETVVHAEQDTASEPDTAPEQIA